MSQRIIIGKAVSSRKTRPKKPCGSPAGVRVCWRSVTHRLYTLERSTNLSAVPSFFTLQPGIPGQTNTKCFTDPTATNRIPYFYRVGVEP